MVSFDLADGYYTLGIREEDSYFFTVNHHGTLYRLAGLPMGWKCISYYFCRLTEVFIRHLREPLPNPTAHTPRLTTKQQPTRPTPSRRYLLNSRWRGARLLPYIDDFFFADNKDAALQLRDRVACLLDRLRLGRNPKKASGSLRKSASTSASISTPQPLLSEPRPQNYMPLLLPSPGPCCNALHATHGGHLPGSSQCSPEKVQYMYLAIRAARFYLHEQHDVLATRT
jgi:hypothetical protein